MTAKYRWHLRHVWLWGKLHTILVLKSEQVHLKTWGCVWKLPHLFVLRFYRPVNPMGSCRALSVNLTTLLLGRLSSLSSYIYFCQKLTTALLDSAEGREWPQNTFHDQISKKECNQPWGKTVACDPSLDCQLWPICPNTINPDPADFANSIDPDQFWRSQLILIYTVCHSVCELVSTTWIK